MLPLAGLLFNVVAGLVVDKAQDLAKEHVEDMIDDLLPEGAREELDNIIKEDPEHTFENAKEALQGAVEGKLPIINTDGSFKALEIDFTVRFDPNTKDFEIIKK
jgi:predicted RNase H-like HicB family nuclease|tara:strand:+ start:1690 stop:2001 length:312 start_codon:yes stop_codon:yes gene_type:complete